MSDMQPDEKITKQGSGEVSVQPLPRSTPVVPGTTDDGTLIEDPSVRAPLVLGKRSFREVTDIVCGYAEAPIPKIWLTAFTICSMIAALGTGMILYLIITGVGVWGLNNQVDWAWDITNFVFWIGIGERKHVPKT